MISSIVLTFFTIFPTYIMNKIIKDTESDIYYSTFSAKIIMLGLILSYIECIINIKDAFEISLHTNKYTIYTLNY